MEAGPHGVLQLLADGVKFLQKEDIFPDEGRPLGLRPRPDGRPDLHLPALRGRPGRPRPHRRGPRRRHLLRPGRLVALGHRRAHGRAGRRPTSTPCSVACGPPASSSPTSCRCVLAVVGVVIQAGTLSCRASSSPRPTAPSSAGTPSATRSSSPSSSGFLIFLAAVQAELTQPPFDMPVAESEIVGGYQVEYTGFRFLLFFMGEFGTAFAFAGHRRRALPRRLVRCPASASTSTTTS